MIAQSKIAPQLLKAECLRETARHISSKISGVYALNSREPFPRPSAGHQKNGEHDYLRLFLRGVELSGACRLARSGLTSAHPTQWEDTICERTSSPCQSSRDRACRCFELKPDPGREPRIARLTGTRKSVSIPTPRRHAGSSAATKPVNRVMGQC